jgi:anti-sigma regulatory factor (Ser/Thr protein kinase)
MKQAEPEHEPTPEPGRSIPHATPTPTPTPAPIPFADPWEYELHFPRDPRSPAIARTTLKAVLTAHGLSELTDRAGLLASELTTNAVRYSTGSATVSLLWTNPVLRVSVTDTCPKLPVALLPSRSDAEQGRGLLILDLLADNWGGFYLDESVFGVGGKSVWFELVLGDGPPSPRDTPASGAHSQMLRQQGEHWDVRGLDDTEVPPVERGHLADTEALCHRDDRGIDASEREVGVLQDQLAHSGQVGRGEVDQFEGAPCDLCQEGRLNLGPALQQPADLGEDGAGQQATAGERQQQGRAFCVPLVAGVQCCRQRACVQDSSDHAESPKRSRIRSWM